VNSLPTYGSIARMPYVEARAALLKLRPADRTWVNGVPVMRVPCAGIWFEVASVWHDLSRTGLGSDAGPRMQMLQLPDAAARCASGYVERFVWR
jgi:hypothetical protein